MPITTRKPAPPSLMQRFRLSTELILMEMAQEAMLRDHPHAGVRPARKSGLWYTVLRIFFLPGYRLTPLALRQNIMRLFFVHKEQDWPAQPWKEQ